VRECSRCPPRKKGKGETIELWCVKGGRGRREEKGGLKPPKKKKKRKRGGKGERYDTRSFLQT